MSGPTLPPPTITSAPCSGPFTTGGAAARAPTARANRADVSVHRVRSIDILSVFVGRSAAGFCHIFLLDAIDVELRRARDDLVERFVEVESRRFREPCVVHARDD